METHKQPDPANSTKETAPSRIPKPSENGHSNHNSQKRHEKKDRKHDHNRSETNKNDGSKNEANKNEGSKHDAGKHDTGKHDAGKPDAGKKIEKSPNKQKSGDADSVLAAQLRRAEERNTELTSEIQELRARQEPMSHELKEAKSRVVDLRDQLREKKKELHALKLSAPATASTSSPQGAPAAAETARASDAAVAKALAEETAKRKQLERDLQVAEQEKDLALRANAALAKKLEEANVTLSRLQQQHPLTRVPQSAAPRASPSAPVTTARNQKPAASFRTWGLSVAAAGVTAALVYTHHTGQWSAESLAKGARAAIPTLST